MMTTCGICGKRIVVMWPQLYVYRRGEAFMCSEDCMIVFDTKKQRETNGFGQKKKGAEEDMAGKLTQEQKDKAVQIAMTDSNPMAPVHFIKECGVKNPYCAWDYIKKKLDPETLRKIDEKTGLDAVKDCVAEAKKAAEKVVKVEKVPEVETPERTVIHHKMPITPENAQNPDHMAPEKLVLQGGVDYQLMVDEERERQLNESLKKLGKALRQIRIWTPKEILRIVDQAALECQAEKEYRWGPNDTLEQTMLQDVKANAENAGIMKLRKKIGELLKAETEGDE